MLSANLTTLRKYYNYSQEQLAEAIGVSRQAIAKWESGETTPDIVNCQALADIYDVTLDELVNYDENNPEGAPLSPKGKHFFGSVTVGDRGQIVIPKKARDLFSIQPGDSLVMLGDEEQGLALVKGDFFMEVTKNILRSKRGK